MAARHRGIEERVQASIVDTTTPKQKSAAALALSAVGVVFGDIGTSPLYAMKESFHGAHPLVPDEPHVLGVLSLNIWASMLTVTSKGVFQRPEKTIERVWRALRKGGHPRLRRPTDAWRPYFR